MNDSLIQAVRDQSKMDDAELIQAGEHGADAGWSGFTYYSDTCAFTNEHRQAIAGYVAEQAAEYGIEVMPFIKGWRCVEDDTPDQAIAAALWGGDAPEHLSQDIMLIENALAWFILEECGRHLEAVRA